MPLVHQGWLSMSVDNAKGYLAGLDKTWGQHVSTTVCDTWDEKRLVRVESSPWGLWQVPRASISIMYKTTQIMLSQQNLVASLVVSKVYTLRFGLSCSGEKVYSVVLLLAHHTSNFRSFKTYILCKVTLERGLEPGSDGTCMHLAMPSSVSLKVKWST